MYEGFANVYDHMMDHIPYEEWFQRLKQYLADKGILTGSICELGCGTGVMTEMFAKAGFQMTGIDRSPDMLAIATAKKEEAGTDILYLEQDMEELELAGAMDAIISVCDSMNYLLQEETLASVFERVRRYLKPEGYFIFDMKTAYCYRNIMGNQTWVEQDEDVSYIWENYYYDDSDINEYMLTIFRRKDSGLYEKIEEAHYQRAYSVFLLKELLEKSGFETVGCFDESLQKEPEENSERFYIVAKLREGYR